MKRILLSFVAVLSLFVLCEETKAQLNITAAIEKQPERLLVGQMSYSWLYKTGTGNYEYWANTDNDFDTHYTTLFLGNDYETAILTLKDLKSLMEKEVAAVNVKQESGDVVLTYAKQLGIKMLWIKQTGQGGKSWISLPMVEKFIKYFEEKQEEEGKKKEDEKE